MNYTIRAVVKSVTFERQLLSSRKDPSDPNGKATIDIHEDLGWFVNFVGSWEKLSFGMEKPTLEKGQRVRITISPE